MTDVSKQMHEIICKFCWNCQENKCLADVPWYCCSICCRFFNEGAVEENPKKKRAPSMKRIMKKTLVETF
jgi:hypothetical protein